jgi:putative membrane protein
MAPDSDALPLKAETQGLRTHPLTGLVQGARWAAAASAGLVGSALSGGGLDLLGLALRLGGGLLIGLAVGFVSWAFTRYVIDGTELRITQGVVTRSSRRIPYERLQSVDIAEPVLARVLGLAELRIEMAGGNDSRTTLRFLTLPDARALRGVLLARAREDDEGSADPADEEGRRSVITVVPPARLVLGTLLSLDFLVAVTAAVALVVIAFTVDGAMAALGGLLPVGSWAAQIVMSRVLAQWDFTLSRGDGGLRIERGLLSRTSQTIPTGRVQGIAVKEPFVWRRLGWQRLEVDVAGYAGGGEEAAASATLLPITDPPLAAAIIAELMAGATTAPPVRLTASPRSWPFAPIGWRYRWVGADDVAFVAQEGWIQRTTSIVPHRKTQSVELRQGPWQRRLGVATVEVHTPAGPVDANGRHLAGPDARAEAFAQLTRARLARR